MHAPTLLSRVLTATTWSNTWLSKAVQGHARSHVLTVLREGLIVGELLIEDSQGTECFGSPKAGHATVTMKILDDNAWARVLFSLDMGFSEAYMQGEFETSSLKGLFDLWLDNRATLSNLPTTISSLVALASSVAIKSLGRQSLAMSKSNVVEAYDTSNAFFESFLSTEMCYSCAIWSDEENGVRGDLSLGPTEGDLEAAQRRKVHHILKKARVRAGDRLLEVGSGWGAMAIEAARLGCTVDTITLSAQQKCLAEQRVVAAGLEDRVTVHLLDYRDLPPSFEGVFDAFVSLEMFEAVGPKYHSAYFKMIDWALKSNRGTAVITATAQPEFRYSDYQPDDFARHYHWPNTFLPSATSLPVAVQVAVPGRLVLESIEDHGPHYPRTLREWGRRFEKNFKGDVVVKLLEEQPELAHGDNLEAFKRKWRYMFAYAEAGYARAYTSLNCWTLSRPENVSICCD